MGQEILKIGELAKKIGLQVETIRYYEQEGLLPPPARSEANYRLYGPAHAERLQFIRHCRALDMALDEIRTLLVFRDAREDNCGEVNSLLDKHIDHVTQRIVELQGLQKQLKALRNQCQDTQAVKDCRILKTLSSPNKNPVRKLGTN